MSFSTDHFHALTRTFGITLCGWISWIDFIWSNLLNLNILLNEKEIFWLNLWKFSRVWKYFLYLIRFQHNFGCLCDRWNHLGATEYPSDIRLTAASRFARSCSCLRAKDTAARVHAPRSPLELADVSKRPWVRIRTVNLLNLKGNADSGFLLVQPLRVDARQSECIWHSSSHASGSSACGLSTRSPLDGKNSQSVKIPSASRVKWNFWH